MQAASRTVTTACTAFSLIDWVPPISTPKNDSTSVTNPTTSRAKSEIMFARSEASGFLICASTLSAKIMSTK